MPRTSGSPHWCPFDSRPQNDVIRPIMSMISDINHHVLSMIPNIFSHTPYNLLLVLDEGRLARWDLPASPVEDPRSPAADSRSLICSWRAWIFYSRSSSRITNCGYDFRSIFTIAHDPTSWHSCTVGSTTEALNKFFLPIEFGLDLRVE